MYFPTTSGNGDGVAVGMQWDKMKEISDLIMPFNSPEILDAPQYKERMFIKMKKNRDLLKKCMETGNYPNFSKFDFSKEPKMQFVQVVCEELKLKDIEHSQRQFITFFMTSLQNHQP